MVLYVHNGNGKVMGNVHKWRYLEYNGIFVLKDIWRGSTGLWTFCVLFNNWFTWGSFFSVAPLVCLLLWRGNGNERRKALETIRKGEKWDYWEMWQDHIKNDMFAMRVSTSPPPTTTTCYTNYNYFSFIPPSTSFSLLKNLSCRDTKDNSFICEYT